MANKFQVAIEEVNDIYFDAPQKLKLAIHSHVRLLTQNLEAATVFIREWRHLSEPKLSDL